MKKELAIKDLKKNKVIAMLAPSFVAEFDYPRIISQLHSLGFDKVVELTFGAKMVNKEYHQQLEKSSNLLITSVCPGIVFAIKEKYPKFIKNLARIDSPMIATSKICKKFYPKHKVCFISPCNFKKIEAEKSKYVDFVIGYQELKQLLAAQTAVGKKKENTKTFSRFYNEYTRIYPLSGGLSKTSHLKGVLKKGEEKVIDGIIEVKKFLNKPAKSVRFLDCTYCKGGCIGGPFLSEKSLDIKKKKVLSYLELAKKEKIPKFKLGEIKKAQGIKFSH